MQEVLVNGIVKLAQTKRVVRWTDCPDMTIAFDWDVKNQKKQTNNPSWISGREENGCRNYFMINLHKSMGSGRDWTSDAWICSQTRTFICSQTHYQLHYVAIMKNYPACKELNKWASTWHFEGSDQPVYQLVSIEPSFLKQICMIEGMDCVIITNKWIMFSTKFPMMKNKHFIFQNTGLKLRVCNRKIFFLFLNQNICCGYSKEPSQWDGSFEHSKHMLKIMGKKIFTIFMPPLFVECGRALSVAHVRPSVRLSVRPWVRLCVLPFVHHLGRYYVSATPPTIFSQSFWNFTGVFVKDWRCAWHLDITLRLIFVTFFTVWT